MATRSRASKLVAPALCTWKTGSPSFAGSSRQPTCTPFSACMAASIPVAGPVAQAERDSVRVAMSRFVCMSDFLGELGGEAGVARGCHGQESGLGVVGDLQVLDELAHGVPVHAPPP